MSAPDPAGDAELFAGLVPDKVVRAYRKLLETEGIPAARAAAELGGDDVVATLTRLGMARAYSTSGPPRLRPASPSLGLEGVLADLIARLSKLQKLLHTGIQRAIDAHGRHCSGIPAAPHDTVKTITDRNEITRTSAFLVNAARRDWMALDTYARDGRLADDHRAEPPEEIRDSLRRRCIYDEAFAAAEDGRRHIRACLDSGEEARVLPGIPMKMQLADSLACLLPNTYTGMGGATLIHAEPIVAAMRQYFEFMWDIADPFSGPAPDRDNQLKPEWVPVLNLLARGLEHKQIATQTGLGKSTVDHYAQEICRVLRTKSHWHAAAMAEHRKWIDWTANPRTGQPDPRRNDQ